MKKLISKIGNFFERLNNDYVGEYSAQCAYFTFLSFIPFIILLLSLIKYMNIERDTLIYILEAILPTIAKNSVADIIQEAHSKSLETISISAIFLLWSAANCYYSLSIGLSSIYKSEDKENRILLRVKGLIRTVIILITIIMVLVLMVFGNRISEIINDEFKNFSEIISFILDIRSTIVIMSLFIIFLIIYKFVPNKRGNRLKEQIPGAVFAAIRLVCDIILFFNLCRCFYKFLNYLW